MVTQDKALESVEIMVVYLVFFRHGERRGSLWRDRDAEPPKEEQGGQIGETGKPKSHNHSSEGMEPSLWVALSDYLSIWRINR